jgi:hypothetical protein
VTVYASYALYAWWVLNTGVSNHGIPVRPQDVVYAWQARNQNMKVPKTTVIA